MKAFRIDQVFIDANVQTNKLALHILEQIKDIPLTVIKEPLKSPAPSKGIRKDKRILYLTEFMGEFCKPCPGTTSDYLCCNYFVINETTGCPLDCNYCILQDYLDSSILKVYVNFEKIFTEVDRLQAQFPERIIRIGSGELSDSLALDALTGLTDHLIPFFKGRKNILFELKTKTDIVPDIVLQKEQSNIVYSLSLNPSAIISKVEHFSATLDERIQSAEKAQNLGFKLGFHFDPVIHHQDWEESYSNLIHRLFSSVNPHSVVWISIGGLRFTPGLMDVIRGRVPNSFLIRDEQITGMDNKIRYFKPLRIKIFKHIYDTIRKFSDDVFVYFCMEDRKTWERSFGFAPKNTNHLDFLFAQSIYKRFPDLEFTEPVYRHYLSF